MADEKIDKNEDIAIDPDMEIRTVTYTVADLASNPGCVISQPFVVRYFEKENPELIVKKVYSFKLNPQDRAVIIKMQVTKRPAARIINHTPEGSSDPAPVVGIADDNGFIQCESLKEPITDPAKLLNAGPGKATNSGIKTYVAEYISREDLEDGIKEKDARITELEKTIDGLVREGVSQEIGGAVRIVELEKENATLKSAIEKFGNGQDFDWNVLARIELLERFIEEHDGHDSDCEIHDAGSPRTGYCSCGYSKEKEAIFKAGEPNG